MTSVDKEHDRMLTVYSDERPGCAVREKARFIDVQDATGTLSCEVLGRAHQGGLVQHLLPDWNTGTRSRTLGNQEMRSVKDDGRHVALARDQLVLW